MAPAKSSLDDLPEAGDRFDLLESLGNGVFGRVVCAIDKESGNKKQAIKIQLNNDENAPYIEQELEILKNFSDDLNLPDFYGAYKNEEEIWLVMEVSKKFSYNKLYFNPNIYAIIII